MIVRVRVLPVLCLLAIPSWSFAQPSPLQGRACVEEATRQLGLDSLVETDPALLRDVLSNEMFLGDFRPLQPVVEPYLNQPVSLQEFKEQVIEGTVTKHPAMVEFFCEAVRRNLFTAAPAYHGRIVRLAHHTFLLNTVVQEMLNDPAFTVQVRDHFVQRRRAHGVSDSLVGSAIRIFRATGSLFETAKMLTVDLAVNQYIGYREKVDLDQGDLRAKNRGLLMNVMEATLTDLARGFHENALSGAVLAANPVQELAVEGSNRDVKQRFVQGWPELYQTWNLAFITGNLSELDLIYPKLLVPLLLNAEHEDYLYRRGVTLWVTASIVLMNKLTRNDHVAMGPFPEAARLWGHLDLKYAREVNAASGAREVVGEGLLRRMKRKFQAEVLRFAEAH